MKRSHTCLTLGIAAAVLIVATIGRGSSTVATPAPAPQTSEEFAGSDTCLICHADQALHFQSTVMGKAFARPKNAKEKLGCESCHGPGKNHVESGGGKERIPIRFAKDSRNTTEEKNGACLSCHEKGNRLFWQG